MENSVQINKEVSIVAYYFKTGIRRLKCFPKKMEYKGRVIEFSETGLRHPTKKGQRMIHVFDMTKKSSKACLRPRLHKFGRIYYHHVKL